MLIWHGFNHRKANTLTCTYFGGLSKTFISDMPIYEATAMFFLLGSRNNYNTTYKMISDDILQTRKKTSFYKICIERIRKGNSREQKKNHNWPASQFFWAVKWNVCL